MFPLNQRLWGGDAKGKQRRVSAFLSANQHIISFKERKQQMRKVRVAVVGCGNVSEKYLPHLQQSSAVELVAVCDPLDVTLFAHKEKEDLTR
jgi:glutamate dehydrogenase/leucine dehydrogenase